VELLEAHEGAHAGLVDGAADGEEVLGRRQIGFSTISALPRSAAAIVFCRMVSCWRRSKRSRTRFIQHAAIVGKYAGTSFPHIAAMAVALDVRPQ
jgi:hypothetical protein